MTTIQLPPCPKCGGPTVPQWKNWGYRIGPASINTNEGSMWAECRVCGFDWPVPALDEGGNHAS